MKIMLVDDDARFRTMLREIFASSVLHPTGIVECGRGEEAVAQYGIHRPDLVIMDVAMAGMDGLAATREIMRRDSSAQIVVFSQYDDPLYQIAALEAGAQRYILKEHIDELISVISLHITSQRKGNTP